MESGKGNGTLGPIQLRVEFVLRVSERQNSGKGLRQHFSIPSPPPAPIIARSPVLPMDMIDPKGNSRPLATCGLGALSGC